MWIRHDKLHKWGRHVWGGNFKFQEMFQTIRNNQLFIDDCLLNKRVAQQIKNIWSLLRFLKTNNQLFAYKTSK
jgi:hypothetical protein